MTNKKILTTHVGSLPRPKALLEANDRRAKMKFQTKNTIKSSKIQWIKLLQNKKNLVSTL